mgnify:CR=1 FL=1
MNVDQIRHMLVIAEAQGILKTLNGNDQGRPIKLYYIPAQH